MLTHVIQLSQACVLSQTCSQALRSTEHPQIFCAEYVQSLWMLPEMLGL